jgi:hypothetical protein
MSPIHLIVHDVLVGMIRVQCHLLQELTDMKVKSQVKTARKLLDVIYTEESHMC